MAMRLAGPAALLLSRSHGTPSYESAASLLRGLQLLQPRSSSRLRRGGMPGSLPASRTRCSSTAARAAGSSSVQQGEGEGSGLDVVLGIESSCDDTGAAVVRGSDRALLGQALSTQFALHAPYGGVYPRLAQEQHAANMDATIAAALHDAGLQASDLDAVAVTVGPGLSLCLAEGVRAARRLAARHRLPLIPCHHMEAHALVARLSSSSSSASPPPHLSTTEHRSSPAAAAASPPPLTTEQPSSAAAAAAPPPSPDQHPFSAAAAAATGPPPHEQLSSAAATAPSPTSAASNGHRGGSAGDDITPAFPYLCLLVSGGHNLLVVVEGVGRFRVLGTTLDDAIGEAFDKSARLLGLELVPSGGAALEALAAEGNPARFTLPIPLHAKPGCNFSYAGLKNAVRLLVEAEAPGPAGDHNRQVRADIAAAFQRAATAQLEQRLRRAAAWAAASAPAPRHLVVSGGVACNRYLRARLQAVAEQAGLQLCVPPPHLCTDNGVMIAWAGYERGRLGLWEHVTPGGDPPGGHPHVISRQGVSEHTWV